MEEGGEGWLGRGMYLCVCVCACAWVCYNHGRRATHQENHNCLRNNVHDDYTIY